ncbi:conserved hypothetical protein [Vibrio coralliirubri]|uniref:nuclear transport factor 2 family protein n=1 Tax=Vibrio coralliirubri TaxID=1516159 RepID=UPI0006315B4D|nr:nuclear transport factor 2 family protein [Vibrio coralliirubri]CDT60631.1 conserved hypothetical protein [Vibrio coralliirubri]CDT70324.1 conserved hypothetical protein [Vibrio coralliirubri]
MSNKLANATNLYMEGIRDGHALEAVTKYTGQRYTQHSTGVRNGIDGFVEFFEPFLKRCPVRDIKIIRSIVDGQFVFVQAFQDINNGEYKWVTTDLFDTDNDDKIIEHWDVISAFEAQPTEGEGRLQGPINHTDLDKTEENKNLIRDFLCDVMVLGQKDKLSKYLQHEELAVYQASDVSPLDSYIGGYDQVFKIVGQGNFVAAYSRVIEHGLEVARFDLFRVEGSQIKEIWVNQEPVPPKAEWVNGGKF